MCIGIEVVLLDRSGLLEQRILLGTSGKEGGAFAGVLGSDVSTDCTTFVEDEAVVILVCQDGGSANVGRVTGRRAS